MSRRITLGVAQLQDRRVQVALAVAAAVISTLVFGEGSVLAGRNDSG